MGKLDEIREREERVLSAALKRLSEALGGRQFDETFERDRRVPVDLRDGSRRIVCGARKDHSGRWILKLQGRAPSEVFVANSDSASDFKPGALTDVAHSVDKIAADVRMRRGRREAIENVGDIEFIIRHWAAKHEFFCKTRLLAFPEGGGVPVSFRRDRVGGEGKLEFWTATGLKYANDGSVYVRLSDADGKQDSVRLGDVLLDNDCALSLLKRADALMDAVDGLVDFGTPNRAKAVDLLARGANKAEGNGLKLLRDKSTGRLYVVVKDAYEKSVTADADDRNSVPLDPLYLKKISPVTVEDVDVEKLKIKF